MHSRAKCAHERQRNQPEDALTSRGTSRDLVAPACGKSGHISKFRDVVFHALRSFKEEVSTCLQKADAGNNSPKKSLVHEGLPAIAELTPDRVESVMQQASLLAFKYWLNVAGTQSLRNQFKYSKTPLEQTLAVTPLEEQRSLIEAEFLSMKILLLRTLSNLLGEAKAQECIKQLEKNLYPLTEELNQFNKLDLRYVGALKHAHLSCGEVLHLSNGARAILLKTLSEAAAEVAVLEESGAVAKKILDLRDEFENGRVSAIESYPGLLLPSVAIPIAKSPAFWKDLRPGDCLYGENSRGKYREEIVECAVVAGQIVITSITTYIQNGVEMRISEARGRADDAIELGSADFAVVTRRAPCSRAPLQTRFNFHANLSRERSIARQIVERALGEIEELVANNLIDELSVIHKPVGGNSDSLAADRHRRLTEFQHQMILTQEFSNGILNCLERIGAYCAAFKSAEIMDSCNELQRIYEAAENANNLPLSPEDKLRLYLSPICGTFEHLFAQVVLEAAGMAGVEFDDSLLKIKTDYLKLVGNLRSYLENNLTMAAKLSSANPQSARIRHLRTEELLQVDTLEELAKLMESAPAGIEASIETDGRAGVLVSDYSAEALYDRVVKGMECLTLRDRKTGELMFAILFYPPGVETHEAVEMKKRVPKQYSNPAELILVIGNPKYRGSGNMALMLDAHILHILRLGGDCGISDVATTNTACIHSLERWSRGELYPQYTRALEADDLPDTREKTLGWLLLVYSTKPSGSIELASKGISGSVVDRTIRQISRGVPLRPAFA